jgi:hypothetical protein
VWEVHVEVRDWVSDVGSSRACHTKYLRTVDLYYHLKMLLGKVLQDREDAHDIILLQLDEVHLLLSENYDHAPTYQAHCDNVKANGRVILRS